MTTPKITIGTVLTNEHVTTETGTPDNLRRFAFDVCGPGAVVRGVRKLFQGETVRFALCQKDRGDGAPPKIEDVWTVRLTESQNAARYTTLRDPGEATCAGMVISPDKLTPEIVIAELAWRLATVSPWSFLLA